MMMGKKIFIGLWQFVCVCVCDVVFVYDFVFHVCICDIYSSAKGN